MNEMVGYLASILIGVSLGLIGSGGSILTVPVLVYLFKVDAVAATAYSLLIVGATSLIGSLEYFKKGLVNVKTTIVFGIPSIIAVFLSRAYLVPAIPDIVFSTGDLIVTKSALLMLLFAVLMIISAYSMIQKSSEDSAMDAEKQQFNYPVILIEGAVVGLVTGLVGAGGGFLIIPALVLLSKLPMKEAVGTSLVIIAAKSLIGFAGESNETYINWMLIGKILLFSVAGIIVGIYLSKKINGAHLKPVFGWFVLVMGIYIILKETIM
jgi:uncharacterized membrane protein YfcA